MVIVSIGRVFRPARRGQLAKQRVAEGACVSDITYLASVARLAGARVGLQLALDHVGKVLGAALETWQLHLGPRRALGRVVGGVARSLAGRAGSLGHDGGDRDQVPRLTRAARRHPIQLRLRPRPTIRIGRCRAREARCRPWWPAFVLGVTKTWGCWNAIGTLYGVAVGSWQDGQAGESEPGGFCRCRWREWREDGGCRVARRAVAGQGWLGPGEFLVAGCQVTWCWLGWAFLLHFQVACAPLGR